MGAFLALPFVLLNAFAGLVAAVWLAFEGEWLAIGLGVSGILSGPFLLGLLLLPGMVFAAPAAKALEKGMTITFATFPVFSLVYTFTVFAVWGIVIFAYFMQSLSGSLVLPTALWSYAVASGPVAFLASKERDNPYSQLSAIIFCVTCAVAMVFAFNESHDWITLTYIFLAGALFALGISMRGLIIRPNTELSYARPVESPPRSKTPVPSSPEENPTANKREFSIGDYVVYPTHGVGRVQGISAVEAAGYSLQVIEVIFEENQTKLSIPLNKASSSGLRKLCTTESFLPAMDTLKGRARIKRTTWSRRAQEYEAKINSGDPVQIAEVVRDLFRNSGQPDQSFGERQIYELALKRLAAEAGIIYGYDKATATERLITLMSAKTN
jgi:CarD family transcriptional regulator